jgi:hypothetical protein
MAIIRVGSAKRPFPEAATRLAEYLESKVSREYRSKIPRMTYSGFDKDSKSEICCLSKVVIEPGISVIV